MAAQGPLMRRHGGYRNLKSFQVAQLVYDLTCLFCDTYVSVRSRTHDQMVQAARSGVQNIVEGSQASGTSKASELKLTNVARASLEELRLDYEDFLRQHSLPQWDRADPRRQKLIALRPKTLEDVKRWERERSVDRIGQVDAEAQARPRPQGPLRPLGPLSPLSAPRKPWPTRRLH